MVAFLRCLFRSLCFPLGYGRILTIIWLGQMQDVNFSWVLCSGTARSLNKAEVLLQRLTVISRLNTGLNKILGHKWFIFIKYVFIYLFIYLFIYSIAWVYLNPRWSSWCSDRKCLLGAILFGAWHPARWSDAQWQDDWRRWRLIQHFLCRDRRREARAPNRLRGSRANCCWYIFSYYFCVLIFLYFCYIF